MKTKKALLIILSVSTILLLIMVLCISENEKQQLREDNLILTAERNAAESFATADTDVYFEYVTKLTPQNVKKWLMFLEVKHADIVLKQSLLETGHYTSDVCKENNNIFGFRKSKHTYYSYPHWIMSIAAYKNWQDTVYDKDSHASYYDFLIDIGYAEDVGYINKLKRM